MMPTANSIQVDDGLAIQLLEELSIESYANIRTGYWTDIYVAVHNYLSKNITTPQFKSLMRKAINNAYKLTGDTAWQDGGAALPLDADAKEYLKARRGEDIGYVTTLGQRLRMLIKSGDEIDITGEANGRANGFAKTLDNIYANIKLLARPNIMLTFTGVDGQPPEYPCPECEALKGKRHRAKWFVAHDKVPGSHTGFTCGGWQCKHILVDDNGRLYTI